MNTSGQTTTRQLKVYCSEHESIFDVSESPKIVCEIRDHALSNNFPYAEFWEYCCDCQTFSRSALEVGRTAGESCPHCDRRTSLWLICDECKTVSYDSGEDTKGKSFHIDAEAAAVSPTCPGCRNAMAGKKMALHKCEDARAVFLTAREICPFCKKQTLPSKKSKQGIKGDTAASKPVKAKNGSESIFCENCGSRVADDSDYCNNCGQSMLYPQDGKTMLLPPPTMPSPTMPPPTMPFPTMPSPPMPPPPIPVEPISYPANPPVKPSPKIVPKNIGMIVGGIVLGLAFLGVVIALVLSPPQPQPMGGNNRNVAVNNSNTATPYPTNTVNTNVSSSTLPSSFENTYEGTMGSSSTEWTLKRDGSNLTGTAETSRTDYLYGTIEDDGSFSLKGKENDKTWTGNYNGYIHSDGTITGEWTNRSGGQPRKFYLSLSTP